MEEDVGLAGRGKGVCINWFDKAPNRVEVGKDVLTDFPF
jgi:hypothetical protein